MPGRSRGERAMGATLGPLPLLVSREYPLAWTQLLVIFSSVMLGSFFICAIPFVFLIPIPFVFLVAQLGNIRLVFSLNALQCSCIISKKEEEREGIIEN